MFRLTIGRLCILNHLLVILILITTFFLIRNIIALLMQSTATISHPTVADQWRAGERRRHSTKMDINSYSVILEKNPFGRPMKFYPLITKTVDDSNGIRMPSDLILVGTAVGPREMSYAIFESKNGRGQKVFKYGEEVFNYGTLSGIEPEYVMIRHGDDIITIDMIDINTASRRRPFKANHSQASLPKKGPLPGIRKIGEKEYLIDRDKVQQAFENPEQILTDARLLPYFQNGKQQGFKVYEVRSGGLYESLGLKNGDVLLKINGLDISSPEVAIQAMSALRGMTRINLDIMRRGTRLSLNYQIR